MNTPKKRSSNPVGRPRTAKGPRPEIVKVSLHMDELSEIMKVTNAPAAYLRGAGLDKARREDAARNPKKKKH